MRGKYICDQPMSIVNRRYTSSSWDEPSDITQRRSDYFLYVPCGKCYTCRLRRSREWHVRLYYEAMHTRKIRLNGHGLVPRVYFATLTFRQSDLPEFDDSNERQVLAPFIKEWREAWRARFGKSPRYFAISDIGTDNERLHLHILLFDPRRADGSTIHINEVYKDNSHDPHLQLEWTRGFVTYCRLLKGINGIHYVAGYMSGENTMKKALEARDNGKPVYKHGKPLTTLALQHYASIFCSQGLGKAFTDTPEFETIASAKQMVMSVGTYKYATPRYYRRFFWRDVIYVNVDEETGEILSEWIDTADMQQRSFMSERVEQLRQEYLDDPPDGVMLGKKFVPWHDLHRTQAKLLSIFTAHSLHHQPRAAVSMFDNSAAFVQLRQLTFAL